MNPKYKNIQYRLQDTLRFINNAIDSFDKNYPAVAITYVHGANENLKVVQALMKTLKVSQNPRGNYFNKRALELFLAGLKSEGDKNV